MLMTILAVCAAAVAVGAWMAVRRGLKGKDFIESQINEPVVTGLSGKDMDAMTGISEVEVIVDPVVEVATPTEAKSTRARSRERNKGKFQADDPATPENEAYKGGRKPRVRVKK